MMRRGRTVEIEFAPEDPGLDIGYGCLGLIDFDKGFKLCKPVLVLLQVLYGCGSW